MKPKIAIIAAVGGAGLIVAVAASAAPPSTAGVDADNARNAQAMLDEGKKTFRFETFGSEAFWATHCSYTKPSPARKTAASVPASLQKPRCLSASRSTPTRCRLL